MLYTYQADLFKQRIPPCGRSSAPFCEVAIVGSSLGDEYHCMTCDCRGRVPLTASSSA